MIIGHHHNLRDVPAVPGTPTLPDIQNQIPQAQAAAAAAAAATRRANTAYWVSITGGVVAVLATVTALYRSRR